MAINRKYLGIKFPFTSKDPEKFFVDMEYNPYREIKNDLMHLLLTKKGQRIRKSSFGTNLLDYIFEPNDEKTKTDIKIEMQTVIEKYFPGIQIGDFNLVIDGNTTTLEIKYEINEGTYKTFETMTINI